MLRILYGALVGKWSRRQDDDIVEILRQDRERPVQSELFLPDDVVFRLVHIILKRTFAPLRGRVSVSHPLTPFGIQLAPNVNIQNLPYRLAIAAMTAASTSASTHDPSRSICPNHE